MLADYAIAAAAGGLYLTDDDHLRLRVLNSGAGVTVTFEGRFINQAGDCRPIVEDLVPTTDRTPSTKLLQLDEGVLLNFSVRPSAGAPRRGQTWVMVELVRGFTGAILPIGVLAQGYVSETERLIWPRGPYPGSTEGRGVLRTIVGTDPAANTESTETVPTNARWRLLNWRIALVTDATVGNRTVQLVIDDGTNAIHLIPAHTTQPASQTFAYEAFSIGAAGFAVSNSLFLPMPPDLELHGGYRVRTSTGSIQAGDNYGAPVLLVQEWIED